MDERVIRVEEFLFWLLNRNSILIQIFMKRRMKRLSNQLVFEWIRLFESEVNIIETAWILNVRKSISLT